MERTETFGKPKYKKRKILKTFKYFAFKYNEKKY